MPTHFSFPRTLLALAAGSFLALTSVPVVDAEVINFDSLSGPSVFNSTLQPLSISTTLGLVTITGGEVLTNETNLPADSTSVYGSVGLSDGSLPFLDPITITFPVAVTNFFLNVYNGNTVPVNYTVADNAGHSQMFTLSDNFSDGQSVIGIPATGNVVTISAAPTSDFTSWDFSIDNLTFNEPLPQSPEPASMALVGLSFVLFGSLAMRRRNGQVRHE